MYNVYGIEYPEPSWFRQVRGLLNVWEIRNTILVTIGPKRSGFIVIYHECVDSVGCVSVSHVTAAIAAFRQPATVATRYHFTIFTARQHSWLCRALFYQ